MRRPAIIAQFPRLGVAVLGFGLLSTSTLGSTAHAAPAAGAAAAAAPTPAAGPDAATKKAAREAYGAGEKAYAAGDYKGAVVEFRKAHDLIATIHAEYWIAMSLSFGDDLAAAFDALTAVLASNDAPKLGEERLASANSRLATVKKTPAAVKVSTTPPGAAMTLDGTAQPGMTPATLSVAAGTHHLTVALHGYDSYDTDLAVKPGQKVDQKIELKAAPAAAPVAAAPVPAKAPAAAPPPPKSEHSLLPAYITLGVGVVGAGVGTIFGIQALSAKKDYDKAPSTDGADKAERDALIADMGFAVALTLGITGIVLLATDDSSEVSAGNTGAPRPARARLDIAPVVTQTTQGAAARLTF
jgi:hypothetical protein